MNDLVCSNIRNSLGEIEKRGLSFSLDVHGITSSPIVYKEGGVIHCLQEEFFGFYALSQMYRGILLSINHLVASASVLEKGLWGPSVSLSYTCAYHLLHSYLAGCGRVLLDSPFWAERDPESDGFRGREAPRRSSPEVIAGCLTRNNVWIFEGRLRSHASRWNELQGLFQKDPNLLAPPFSGLFRYLFRNRFKVSVSLEEFVIEGKRPVPVELADAFPEFLRMIPLVRHGSLYQSFGSDIHVYTDIINRDAFSGDGLSYQAEAFYEFASGLLVWTVRDLLELVSQLQPSFSTKVALLLTVHHPWFDSPELAQLVDSPIRAEAEMLLRSLDPES